MEAALRSHRLFIVSTAARRNCDVHLFSCLSSRAMAVTDVFQNGQLFARDDRIQTFFQLSKIRISKNYSHRSAQ